MSLIDTKNTPVAVAPFTFPRWLGGHWFAPPFVALCIIFETQYFAHSKHLLVESFLVACICFWFCFWIDCLWFLVLSSPLRSSLLSLLFPLVLFSAPLPFSVSRFDLVFLVFGPPFLRCPFVSRPAWCLSFHFCSLFAFADQDS